MSRLIHRHFVEVPGNEDIFVLRLGRLQIEFLDVYFDQIRKQQMREQGELPRLRFFLIEDEVNDLAQVWVGLLVVVLQLLFQLRDGDRNRLEENCWV